MLDNYPLFVAACVLLVLTPGPNLLYLISRTLCQGRAAGLLSLAGTTTGFIVHIVAAALGLSAVLLAVPVLFDVVRYRRRRLPRVARVGFAARARGDAVRARSASRPSRRRSSCAPDCSRASSTPRSRCSTSRSFPQFIVPAHGSVLLQSLLLGATQIVIAVIGDALFVLAAARVSRWLAARPAWTAVQRYVQGGVFAAIAVKLAADAER